MLNFAQIASDAGVPAATVREYYFLLEDTLVGIYTHVLNRGPAAVRSPADRMPGA